MKAPESLKQIEHRAYRATFEDGIYDILIGGVIVIMAWIPLLESFRIPRLYGYLLVLLPLLFAWLGKRYITIPRLGLVEFGPKRKTKRKLLWLIGAVIIFLQMPLLLATAHQGFPNFITGAFGPQVLVIMGAGPVLVLAAYLLDYPRLYIYAAIIFFGIPQGQFLLDYVDSPFHSLISLGLPGAAVLVYGLSLLFKFVQKYPRAVMEANHAG